MTDPIVIVGGGLAAGTAVTTLREGGYDGDLVVFADEHDQPVPALRVPCEVLVGVRPVRERP